MISIVVIEYHSIEEIKRFITSIDDKLMEEFEIIVSSNSLYDQSEQNKLVKLFPGVKWSFNNRNGGFAYGMNEGLKIAKGDILVVTNPDVKLKVGLDVMMKYLLENREVGIVGPKMVDSEGEIQDSFRNYITPWRFVFRQIGRIKDNGALHVKDSKNPVECDWVIGAFMMCRRDFYQKVGGLSDDYFMYCEDMDWCKRAHIAGYKVVYYPQAVIEYKGTRSARRSSKYAKIFLSSLFTYWRKYGFI